MIDPKTITIAIPIHYQPTAGFMASTMGLASSLNGANFDFLVGDSHPDRARNRLTAKFLKSDFEWMFFIDADLTFDPTQIKSFVELADKDARPVIAGFYAKKVVGPAQWVGNALTGEPDAESGLIELVEAGTGCLMFHRSTLDAIIDRYPEIEYQSDPDGKETEWDIFGSGVVYDERVGRKRWLSEDWMFCRRLRECGYKIWGDPETKLAHEGPVMFPTHNEEGGKV